MTLHNERQLLCKHVTSVTSCASRESSDQPDPEERTVPKDQRVARVSREMLDLLDQTGRR